MLKSWAKNVKKYRYNGLTVLTERVFDPKIARGVCDQSKAPWRKYIYETCWRELHGEQEDRKINSIPKFVIQNEADSLAESVRCNHDLVFGIVMYENQVQHQHLSELLLLLNKFDIFLRKLVKWAMQVLQRCIHRMVSRFRLWVHSLESEEVFRIVVAVCQIVFANSSIVDVSQSVISSSERGVHQLLEAAWSRLHSRLQPVKRPHCVLMAISFFGLSSSSS